MTDYTVQYYIYEPRYTVCNVVEMTVDGKEENFCHNYVQELGLGSRNPAPSSRVELPFYFWDMSDYLII